MSENASGLHALVELGYENLCAVRDKAIKDHEYGDPYGDSTVFTNEKDVVIHSFRAIDRNDLMSCDCTHEIELQYDSEGHRAIYGVNEEGNIVLFCD